MLKEPLPREQSETPPSGFDPKYGDRILGWCLLASILINLGFGLWLSRADIYGTQRQAEQNKQMKVAIYRPPVKQKPKPKPKPKIIPPKPKIIPPKVVHLRTPPPKPIPHFTPHPPPPAPRAPAVGHTVKSNSPTAVAVGPVSQAPVAVPQTPGTDTRPQAPIVAPPAPPPPVVTPPAPVYHAPPPPPKPAPPQHDRNYLPNVSERDAQLSGDPNVDASGIDPLPTSSCVVSFVIDVDGHIRRVKVKKSSGSNDFDQRCVDAVQRDARGVPAVQDNEKYEASGTFEFSPPGG